jgi:hypothetical protein
VLGLLLRGAVLLGVVTMVLLLARRRWWSLHAALLRA